MRPVFRYHDRKEYKSDQQQQVKAEANQNRTVEWAALSGFPEYRGHNGQADEKRNGEKMNDANGRGPVNVGKRGYPLTGKPAANRGFPPARHPCPAARGEQILLPADRGSHTPHYPEKGHKDSGFFQHY